MYGNKSKERNGGKKKDLIQKNNKRKFKSKNNDKADVISEAKKEVNNI